MPKWTAEQQEAIAKEGSNIIVSAGAGSGKTAVLSERVLRKIQDGVNVNELLILTFTKAAAFEMKERIRKKIAEKEELAKQLEYIDSSYITTFDSYALKVVKKYHYLLNIPSHIAITDESVMYLERKRILDNIFDELYTKKDPLFLNLIKTFCIKDDKEIKKAIILLSSKLDLKYNKQEYLENYITEHFNDSYINIHINKYIDLLKKKIKNIKPKVDELSLLVDSNYLTMVYDSLTNLLNADNYSEILNNINVNLPKLPRNSGEESKKIKEEIKKIIEDVTKILTFKDEDDIKKAIYLTKDYVEVIINIILELDKILNKWKDIHSLYEFTDISKLAIKIVKENEEVRNEIKYYFKEILVDEYQDTSDLQEEFISLIENNNVYMVGDIKQSIYRFRNANPYIFKNKYDHYSENDGGYKIDLNKNFRSRLEVLDNINWIFNLIMNDDIGGANYIKTHQMIFGNNTYLEQGNTGQNNNFEILNYQYDKNISFTKEEIEIFIIAQDILNKVQNKYQVFDKDQGVIRDITYSDFVILMDRSTNFDLYKKIFGFFKIPLTKYTDTSITNEMETLIIKNILSLIINTYEKKQQVDFKYSFMSIARSFLFSYSDEEIFNYLENNNYETSSLMTLINEIVEQYDHLTPRSILEMIISKFAIYSKLVLIGDIDLRMLRYQYLMELSANLEDAGYSIKDFYEYLDILINDDYKIKVDAVDTSSNSVKIMTIHKSKGLEYHICYYSGLYAGFNIRELNEKFLYDNKYGIITPYFDEGISNTIYKYLLQDDYIKEEISEKIRLFYVALTRAKEKMIFVTNLKEDDNCSELNDYIKIKYRSFLDILQSIYPTIKDYIKKIDINSLNLTKDYTLIRKSNYQDHLNKSNEIITFKTLNIESKEVSQEHFSKTLIGITDMATKNKLAFGEYMHYLLEAIDFKNPSLEDIDPKYHSYINNFLNLGLDFQKAKIYKEYEFIDGHHHGIIDLILEYPKYAIIVDYKLKHINDPMYLEQLHGYQDYLATKLNKPVNIYLYSIMDHELKKII